MASLTTSFIKSISLKIFFYLYIKSVTDFLRAYMSEKEIMLTKALVRKCDHEHSLLFRALVWFPSPMSDGTQLPVTSVPQNMTLFQPQAPPCKYAQIHTRMHTHAEGGRGKAGGRTGGKGREEGGGHKKSF